MMKLLLLLPFFFSGAGFAVHKMPEDTAAKPLATEAAPGDLCQLKGSVYVTKVREEAHFIVYVEEYETSADLVVFSEENRLFADQPGIWHFTDKRAFADFNIYLTDSRAFADFSIAYTDVASFAGCR